MSYNLAFVRTKAREQAEIRGHVLGIFKTTLAGVSAEAACMTCGQTATCKVQKVNDVSGDATRTQCRAKREHGHFFHGEVKDNE